MIHIVNGDVVGEKITNIGGEVIVWREMYDYGPLLNGLSQEELNKHRANFFEEKVGIPASLFMKNCEQQVRLLHGLLRSAEITLWFEHDRYDQTMLMFLLNELSSEGFENLSMVTINEYPGIEPFYGLGQLTTEQLIGLFDTGKQPISKEQIDEAVSGWAAYTSKDPSDIEQWLGTSKNSLPFLKQALYTHLSYFPSLHNGLNEVENLVLEFINDRVCSFTELFQNINRQRINDGLSDLHFASMMNLLTLGKYPLLQCDPPLLNYNHPSPNSNIQLTSYGLDVLHGKRDRFEFTGIDWWLGGVHLQNDEWRFDSKRLIKSEDKKYSG